MRILLTGAAGQLGRAFLETARGRHDVVPAYRSDAPEGGVALDLADLDAIARVVREARPDWVVHAAAMTDVDGCEREPAKARLLNAEATGALARACAATGARLAYVSTDYVFDGRKGRYVETDAVNPRSVYGLTKLEGERAAQAALPSAVVARTSVVYGPHKRNFVTWLVGELRAGRRVRIVRDQIVTPTLTYDLARQLLALVEARAEGVWHTAGATRASRLEMAEEVCRAFGLDASLVDPVSAKDMTWLAERPLDSSLDTTKVATLARPMTLPDSLRMLQETLP